MESTHYLLDLRTLHINASPMKVLLRLAIFALVIVVAVIAWRKYRGAPDASPPTKTPAPTVAVGPDLSLRTWTNQDGRSFEGSLVSAKGGQVILRRANDSSHFQLPVAALSDQDRAFVEQQSRVAAAADGAGFPKEVPGVYMLNRKTDIKGNLMRVPASELVGGWQNVRVQPMFWFLLSTQLHGAGEGSLWVRVDERTFKAHSDGTLLNKGQLSAFMNAEDKFIESMPWPKPDVTIVEAQYGPHAAGNNVTHKLMLMASQSRLPAVVGPELFDLPSHAPATWELSVLWRTATGEVRRTVRDGASLAWP